MTWLVVALINELWQKCEHSKAVDATSLGLALSCI